MQADLIDHMGTDLTVVNAARVSFHKESKEFVEQDEKLIRYLARNNHFTPFTHPQITLREKVPIFVARQRFKHTVGFSYNEVSRRYVNDSPNTFVPSVIRSRPDGSIKQGSGWEHPRSTYWLDRYHHASDLICELYDDMIEDGVAPEQARMILPLATYTEYYVTGSLSAYARAFNLRSDPHAQMEIQELAKLWDHIIRPLYPVSWSALVDA